MPTALARAMDVVTARRLAIAVAGSLALHGALVAMIEVQPPSSRAAGMPVIQAWLERAPGPVEEPSGPSEHEAPRVAAEPRAPQSTVEALPAPDQLVPDRPSPDPAPLLTHALPQPAAASNKEPATGLELPLTRDLTYYPIGALDTPPQLLGSADECYPQGATGEVAYLLLIDEAGSVNEASVVEVKPEGLFTAGAVYACRNLKFAPALKDGRTVRSRVRFVIGSS